MDNPLNKIDPYGLSDQKATQKNCQDKSQPGCEGTPVYYYCPPQSSCVPPKTLILGASAEIHGIMGMPNAGTSLGLSFARGPVNGIADASGNYEYDTGLYFSDSWGNIFNPLESTSWGYAIDVDIIEIGILSGNLGIAAGKATKLEIDAFAIGFNVYWIKEKNKFKFAGASFTWGPGAGITMTTVDSKEITTYDKAIYYPYAPPYEQ